MKFDLNKEFENYNENYAEQASDELRDAYRKMREAFDEYLDYVQEEAWRSGFNHAIRLIQGGEKS
ncbi:hypothetical protein [Frisingicoccus sp.]|uniref:hypothetical protein n=1 Tax=Frisingicoccus sp. TaxID=1918627 RepID=UPI003AB480DA